MPQTKDKVTKSSRADAGTLVEKAPKDETLPAAKAPKAGSMPVAAAAAMSPSEAQRKALYNKIPKERREAMTAELAHQIPIPVPATLLDQRHTLIEEAFIQHEAADQAEAQGDPSRAGSLREYEDDILERLARLDRRAERSKENRPS